MMATSGPQGRPQLPGRSNAYLPQQQVVGCEMRRDLRCGRRLAGLPVGKGCRPPASSSRGGSQARIISRARQMEGHGRGGLLQGYTGVPAPQQ